MFHKGNKGFSLIELLVVIAILGTLAAIAVPTYHGYRMRANRAEARSDLLESTQVAERFFTRNNTYVAAVAAHSTSHSLYNVTYSNPGGAATYLVTATATGSQVADTPCLTMTINNTGVKAPAACW